MSNKELIERVRNPHGAWDQTHRDLADALEAAQQRITELETVNKDTLGQFTMWAHANGWMPPVQASDLETERDALVARVAVLGRRPDVPSERVTELEATLAAIRKAANVAYPGPHDTDAGLMRIAADHLEHGYPVGGSNLTAAVIRVLREVATALDSAPADHLNTVKAECEALLRQSLANRDDAIDKRRRVAELEAAQADVWDEGWHAFGRYIRRLEDAEAAGWGVNITEPQNPYRTDRGAPCVDCGRTDGGCDRIETGEQSND